MTVTEYDQLPESIRDRLEARQLRPEDIRKLEWARDPLGTAFIQRLDLEPKPRNRMGR